MDNYNNNGYNNDSWNNPQGNGPDPQQNNYSNQGYQQPYGTDNNQGYQQPYGADNNQGYQQQSYGANDYQQPYGSQPDYNNYNQNNYQQQYPNYNQYPVEDKSAKNNATASLVLGIIGLCCCAPCGIVGQYFLLLKLFQAHLSVQFPNLLLILLHSKQQADYMSACFALG